MAPSHTTPSCLGCTGPLSPEDRYCRACGQRSPRPDDFSMRRILGMAWSELTSTDSRLWRSLVGIFRPGRLTQAYLARQWQRYLPPLRLYLLVSGVYFLLAWDVTYLASLEQITPERAAAMPPELMALYRDPAAVEAASDLTAVFKFLLLPLMGLWIALLHRRNGRPLGEHMVFALHYTCFDFALFSVGGLVVALASDPMKGAMLNTHVAIGALLLFAWATVASRRVYQRSWPGSVWRGAMVLFADFLLSALAGQLAVLLVLLPRL